MAEGCRRWAQFLQTSMQWPAQRGRRRRDDGDAALLWPLLPDTTQRPVPDAEALCVYRKLRFGESMPSLWVVLAPAPMTEGLIHLPGGQLLSFAATSSRLRGFGSSRAAMAI